MLHHLTQEALLTFSKESPVSAATATVVQLIYSEAAAQAAQLKWLPQLLSTQPVLLVKGRDGSLHFTSASDASSSSNGAVYVPDAPRLASLFEQECQMLAVAAEKVPILRDLLECIQPPLPLLSSSVMKSYAISLNAERKLNSIWTERLKRALPLVARVLYKDHTKRYKHLLESGELEQLMGMLVYDCPGLEEELTLGDVTKKQKAVAAVETQEDGGKIRLLIDTTDKSADTLLRHVENTYGSVLLGDERDPAALVSFRGLVGDMLRAVSHADDYAEAEEVLKESEVGEIPEELRLWVGAGRESGHGAAGAALSKMESSEQSELSVMENNEEEGTQEVPVSDADSKEFSAERFQEQLKQVTDAAAVIDLTEFLKGKSSGSTSSSSSSDVDRVSSVPAGYGSYICWPPTEVDIPGRAIDGASSSSSPTSSRSRRESSNGSSDVSSSNNRESSSDDSPASSSSSSSSNSPTSTSRSRRESSNGSNDASSSNSHERSSNGSPASSSSSPTSSKSRRESSSNGSAAGSSDGSPASSSSSRRESSSNSSLTSSSNTDPASSSNSTRASSSNSRRTFRASSSNSSCPSRSSSSRGRGAVHASSSDSNPPTSDKDDFSSYSTGEPLLENKAAGRTSSSSGDTHGASAQSGGADYALIKEIGALGEAFVYAALSEELPGFGPENWHSGNRTCLDLPRPGREPSYDFLYEDVEGVLSGRAGTLCFIEVKSTSSGGENPMPISTKEWELAQKVHRDNGSAMYIVFRVAGVCPGGQPRIVAVY